MIQGTDDMLTAINLSNINLADVLEENTERLAEREAENNKWLNKKNHIWKYASKTPQGDAGESVVATSILLILTEVYGDEVQCVLLTKAKENMIFWQHCLTDVNIRLR